MSFTLRVDEPRELLALVPFQLGFHPTESVVLVSLRHPHGQVGLVARADLADLVDRDVADRLVGHLLSDGAAATVMVVYTCGTVSRRPDPVCDVWRVRRRVQEAAGALRLSGTWVVQPTGYRRLGCLDLGCCPPEGRSLDELGSTQVGAHMVLAGASVSASRDTLAHVPTADEADLRRSRAAGVAWTRARAADGLRGPAHVDWLERSLALWRLAVDGRATAAELGQLGAALEDVVLRDAVLLSFVPGADSLPEDLVRSVGARGPSGDQTTASADGARSADGADSTGVAVGDAVASIVDPGVGVRPGDDAERARHALEQVVAHRDDPSAPARTLLALIAWWGGDSALARAHLERGDARARYRLAQLLRRAVDAGLPPGWAAAGAA
jgi:hypothetical protein